MWQKKVICGLLSSVVDPEKHMVCEPCNSKLLGGFDPDKKEVQYSAFCNEGIWWANKA